MFMLPFMVKLSILHTDKNEICKEAKTQFMSVYAENPLPTNQKNLEHKTLDPFFKRWLNSAQWLS